MQIVTVSPKYQVVIPKNIRDALKLRPGQKLRMIEYDGRIGLARIFFRWTECKTLFTTLK
ncbi:MAG: AbrB/MazE/SpoVT family DNA-binding domain-containing protein [Desulfobacterales bacterium]